MSSEKVKMLTVKQASGKSDIAVSTINLYCRNGRLPNAVKTESPIGEFWLIPETDLSLITQRKRGRPVKAKAEAESGK